MTRTIHDTCNDKTVRRSEVQDVTVHLPGGLYAPAPLHFVRGPNHIPSDVVEFAIRKGWDIEPGDAFLTDAKGKVLWPADVYTEAERKEVLRLFRSASALYLYLRLHGVTP
jgi:hypothetical protein